MNSVSKHDSTIPDYFGDISYSDQESYKLLQKDFSSGSYKNQRNHSVDFFLKSLAKIKNYIYLSNVDVCIRSLVCGIYFFPDSSLCLNVKQLTKLLSSSKSSVNLMFQKLGYGIDSKTPQNAREFTDQFPRYRESFSFTRQWTLRRKIANIPEPEAKNEFISFPQALRRTVIPQLLVSPAGKPALISPSPSDSGLDHSFSSLFNPEFSLGDSDYQSSFSNDTFDSFSFQTVEDFDSSNICEPVQNLDDCLSISKFGSQSDFQTCCPGQFQFETQSNYDDYSMPEPTLGDTFNIHDHEYDFNSSFY